MERRWSEFTREDIQKIADKQKSYINLLTLTKKVLEQCIDLLAIDAPERM